MVYRLTIDLGERTDRLVLREGEHLVGSHPECGVVVRHPTISRRHAKLVVRPTGVEIEDLGSRNGTWMDGRRVESAALPPGSRLLLGGVPAVLDHVEDAELEIAIGMPGERVVPQPAESPPGARSGDATTASLGSLRRLALQELPRLLDLLTAGGESRSMVQAVGSALYDGLPCLGIEIRSAGPARGDEDAVLFTAKRTSGHEAAVATARVEAGDHVVEATFAHEAQSTALRPLIVSFARLITLAERDRRSSSPPTREAPALPEPATMVPEVREIYERAARVARGDVSVLILGESGTGKEVLARYVHAASTRSNGPFVALNCAALPRDLLEAELFGIEEKVATGVAARPGKFESAHGGTLFLDEIGDMAAETQARILRVLQEGEVYRIGGTRPRPARVRTIAATNRDLRAMLESGAFRTDLYHRIADWTVTLPPLRERRADIPNLAAWFLAEEAARHGVRAAGISRAALERLEAYGWPGNVRQLQREMARTALFLETGQALETGHLDEEIRSAAPAKPATLRERLEGVERREIERALAAAGGDVGVAARELGMGRSTLYRRMTELAIGRPDRDASSES